MTDAQFFVLMATISIWGFIILLRLGAIADRLPPKS